MPLAPNVNDKGCAFGGSLVSLMTLAGWALVELALRQRGEDCDVFVGESHVRYLAPVWDDFQAHARLHRRPTGRCSSPPCRRVAARGSR